MIKALTISSISKSLLLIIRWSLIVMVFVAVFSSYAFGQQGSDGPLTNAAVVKLVKAGFKDKTIIAIIDSRPNRFNLETEQLIQLKHSGVSDNIILAMLSFRDLVENDDERWADDSFFGRSNGQRTDTDPKSPQGGSSDIFGSGSSSRSQSRGRNGVGGGENEGNITGSATVRIIRPASEAGNAPAKLERTPTLNNEAVIRLVEAGFSEGTIIKRIEDSPAEFDLSPDKIAELHKRRVSDPIIAAMTEAMSDGPVKPQSQPERN
jgi:hypothetical protein